MQLKDYVPSFLSSDKILSKVYEEQQKQVDSTNKDIQDLINQCFVETATWGLDTWEKELGIQSNYNESYSIRRSRILAKLRGQGTTTKEVIKQIAESYVEEAQVTEHNPEYYFNLKLLSHKGFPYGFESLYEAIGEVKPSHLNVFYKLTSITNSKLYVAGSCINGQKITVYPWRTRKISAKGKINISQGINRDSKKVRVYPKEVN